MEQDLHRGDGGDGSGVRGERGEGRRAARLLDVAAGEAGGEVRLAGGGGRSGNDVRAVDERARVLAEHGHLRERGLERALELRLVVDERLPLAGGALIARKEAVGLEAELAAERGLDLTLVAAVAGEERAAELGLDEELRVEQLGGGVEGRSRDGRVDVVGSSDRVPVRRGSV